MTEIHDVSSERQFDVELVGSYGSFKSSRSFPVDYFLTTMTMPQAHQHIKFARDIEMEEVNFELLMQRDIWEERVEDKIIPYLTQNMEKAGDIPIFFPPLLVAIVPTREQRIEEHYPTPQLAQLNDGLHGVVWPSKFQIHGKIAKGDRSRQISGVDSELEIVSNQAVLSVRTTSKSDDAVEMVVIDGQHRLRALQLIFDSPQRTLIKDLQLPICILFPPNSYRGYDQSDHVPSVPRIFRSLFVDVNSTMEQVGGHFTILLSDKTVGDIACRSFCEYVLEAGGKEKLAQIEWNTRTKKNSFNVTQEHTITSIGIIKRGLDENFSTDQLMNYLFEISAGDEEIFPEDSDEDQYYPKIKWDTFSYAQSKALSQRAKATMVPALYELFFETKPFSTIKEIFHNHIEQLEETKEKDQRKGICAEAVYRHMLELTPLGDDPDFRKTLKDVQDSISQQIDQSGCSVARYALFQRAVFGIYAEIAKLCLKKRLSPEVVRGMVSSLMCAIFEEFSESFSPKNQYMQFSVFDQKRIKTREDSRKAFRFLLLAHLLNDGVREAVVKVTPESEQKSIDADLVDKGFYAAGELLALYRREREKAFKNNFDLDYTISREERERLKIAEGKKREDEREVQLGDRDSTEVDREFDDLVVHYISGFVQEAEMELKEVLQVDVDILERDDSDEDEDYSDER